MISTITRVDKLTNNNRLPNSIVLGSFRRNACFLIIYATKRDMIDTKNVRLENIHILEEK